MNKKRLQPKDGDTLLHCGQRDAKTLHWWHLPDGMEFRRPDGKETNGNWIVSCDPCAQAVGFDALKITIRGEGTWMGDAPILPEEN